MRGVTIIVPIYGDWPSLSSCIESLIEHANTKHKVLLCNDNGPEAGQIEKNIKKKIKGLKNFEYHRNSKNLGFIKNCNRAVFDLDNSSNDILLLNSDAIVTSGFLEPLQATLYSNKHDIATVSPRSNNATIATLPIRAATTKNIRPEDSYNIFTRYNKKFPLYNISPVSHGFCMLISRDSIEKYGLFDEIFGKGYGEEVDFCMRLRKVNLLSAICNHSFVYHAEAKSFGIETKAKLVNANEKIIIKRYPEYRRLARDYRLNQIDLEEIVYASRIKKLPVLIRSYAKLAIRSNRHLRSIARKLKAT